MKISDLMKKLEELKEKLGDVNVLVYNGSWYYYVDAIEEETEDGLPFITLGESFDSRFKPPEKYR